MSRRRKAKPRILPAIWALIEGLIRQDWSPEQVSGRLESEYNLRVSHEWIYQHILADKRVGGDLYRHLRCQKKRRKRYGSYDRRGILPNRVSIDERPEVVDSRERLGDWEVDTIIGKGRQPALVTLTERKSRLTLLRKVERKTAEAVAAAVVTLLMPWKAKTHTLTSDNGKEFALHQIIAKLIEADYFFAHPYAAWERGTTENKNGLLRQYFPKKRDLETVSDDEIEFVMCNLNNRPRKTLAYNTPFEVFLSCCT